MTTQKKIDWLEFTFDKNPRMSSRNIGTKFINQASHAHLMFGPWEVFYSSERERFFVQWTGSQCGYVDPLHHLTKFSEYMNLEFSEITIKRIDFCFDTICEMPEIKRDNCITKAKTFAHFDSNGKTYYFGRSPLMLRIYDKTAELRQTPRTDKLVTFQARTGIDYDSDVTRSEFQIRSEYLRKIGVSTAQDLFDHSEDVQSYLVHDWFCHLSNSGLKKWNSRNFSLPERPRFYSPFWQSVSSTVSENFHVSPVEKQAADSEQLVKAGFGTLATAYVNAKSGHEHLSKDGFKEYVKKNLDSFVPPLADWGKYLNKRA